MEWWELSLTDEDAVLEGVGAANDAGGEFGHG